MRVAQRIPAHVQLTALGTCSYRSSLPPRSAHQPTSTRWATSCRSRRRPLGTGKNQVSQGSRILRRRAVTSHAPCVLKPIAWRSQSCAGQEWLPWQRGAPYWKGSSRTWCSVSNDKGVPGAECFRNDRVKEPEKAMAPHSSTLAWKLPWTEEPGGLQSMGSPGVGHDWSDLASSSSSRVKEQRRIQVQGNGDPLQCSCLENPRDGGAWCAAVYGVAQSRTRLKRLSKQQQQQSQGAKENTGSLYYLRRSLTLVYVFNSYVSPTHLALWSPCIIALNPLIAEDPELSPQCVLRLRPEPSASPAVEFPFLSYFTNAYAVAVNCSAGVVGDAGSIPGSRRSPGVGKGNPLLYSCLKNRMDGGAWWPP